MGIAGPSPEALEEAGRIIAAALTRLTGKPWVPLSPDDGEPVDRPAAGGGADDDLGDQ
jgi:hypothetical protein